MVALRDTPQLGHALDRLAGALEALEFGGASAELAHERDRLSRAIRVYLIPRVEDPTTPLTVVFAGPTGSGKSTLINTLTGLDMSSVGVLRPTTTGPVVLAAGDRIGGYQNIAGIDCHVVSGDSPVLGSMVLIDTPDIDSTAVGHREVAERLIDTADVVVFVTSALRYADAVPWQVLRRVRSRGADVIQVLNRTSSATAGAGVDFRSRLASAGFDDDLITIPEHHLPAGSQSVPSLAARVLRRRLAALAVARDHHSELTVGRVLESTLSQVEGLDRSVRDLFGRLEDRKARLSTDLARMAAGLDLKTVGTDLVPPTPETVSQRSVRRWIRSARRRGRLSSTHIATIVGQIETAVHGDLRRWTAAESLSDHEVVLDPGRLLTPILPVVRLAMEGWIDFVRRVGEEESGRDGGLAELVLVDAATSSEVPASAAMFFGDGAELLVGRARRELYGRVEVVYGQVASQVLDLLDDRIGKTDMSDVRDAVGAVRSTLAPVHA